MTSVIRVALAGATGRTGAAVASGLSQAVPGIELVACVAPSLARIDAGRMYDPGCTTFSSVAAVDVGYDVLVDFTNAGVAPSNLRVALGRGAHVVLGTTGLSEEELTELGHAFADAGRGLLYAPNCSIGALLMMQFAQRAARWLSAAEIVETHHHTKRDAPSGTAVRTAHLIEAARPAGSSVTGDVPIHSLRLPGAVAHQEVVFGGDGELLTIRHDALDRRCYVAGVTLAIRHVVDTVGLTTGLEHLL